MKKEIKFDFSSLLSPVIMVGKSKYENLLRSAQCMSVLSEVVGIRELLATVQVPSSVYAQYSREKMLLVNKENGAYITVKLEEVAGMSENTIALTQYVRDALSVGAGDTVYLCAYQTFAFKEIRTQRISHIRENNLMLSPKDYQGVMVSFADSPCTLFEVYNTLTKENIVVKRSHIFIDESLPDGAIRLNRKQRHWLGLELPMYLTETRWDKLMKNASAEEQDLLCSVYNADNRVLNKDVPHDKKQDAQRVIKKYSYGHIRIIPVVESILIPLKKRWGKAISDFFVGKSTISLTACRPYEMDEGADIVRITQANMNVLGVDEMDKVILQYKHRRISCRVLPMEDEERFLETNTPSSKELRVGIPVHIRKKLGITDLASSVKIDRDTGFIFKKSINEQVVPILLTFCSTQLFSGLSGLWSVLMSLLFTPLVIYVNLSSKRNMRG